MKCPNCSNKMIVLFTSTLCERCNPTNAVKPTASRQTSYRGFICTHYSKMSMIGNTVRVWPTAKLAYDSFGSAGHTGDVYEVVSSSEFVFDQRGFERRIVSAEHNCGDLYVSFV